MSSYYVVEMSALKGQSMTAGSKAREDVESVLEAEGFERLEVTQSVDLKLERKGRHLLRKVARRAVSRWDWGKALSIVEDLDTVVMQLPIRNHSMVASKLIADLGRNRGVRVVCVVHDLEVFRLTKSDAGSGLKRSEIVKEEETLLRGAYRVIVHNERMRDSIENLFGASVVEKCVSLDCFDYLTDDAAPGEHPERVKDGGVVIAGNLSRKKAGYAYELPKRPRFRLYGINYEGRPAANVEYCGAFPPDELPSGLEGGFGLVWDGPSAKTCEGVYGEYLRVNNPHKTSLYLASGMPVIIWEEAAMAEFVRREGVGITVASLDEIENAISRLGPESYASIVAGARRLSSKIRSGHYLSAALQKTFQ